MDETSVNPMMALNKRIDKIGFDVSPMEVETIVDGGSRRFWPQSSYAQMRST